jgi:iodotyrosine deiodinase
MDDPPAGHEPLSYVRRPAEEMLTCAEQFYAELRTRRSTRSFASEPVPRALIELAILSAGTAPSGAHRQPWFFVAIDDPALKHQIRAAAEEEERITYEQRMSEQWRRALAPIGTTYVKEHITAAPWVVVLFKQRYELLPTGERVKNYYVDESVGIAAGLFITAIHHMGLCTLTHTPSPMGFLSALLGRPQNETPVLLLPIGYPAADATVPRLTRKSLAALVQWNQGAPPATAAADTAGPDVHPPPTRTERH